MIHLFYTDHSPALSYRVTEKLLQRPNQIRLESCITGTANAMDFQLISALGCLLSACDPGKNDFKIISDDRGYDATVAFWTKRGMPVTRITSCSVASSKTPAQAKKKRETDVISTTFQERDAKEQERWVQIMSCHYGNFCKKHHATATTPTVNSRILLLHSDFRTEDFAKEVLNHMRDRLVMYQEEYGDLYNLEATPAESTTYRLAKHDKEQYPDIITAGEPGDTPYYTNSSHLPVGYTADIFDALDIQDGLQTLYTSGTVFHAFLGEKLPNWKAAAALVRKIAENYSLPYYTLSPTYYVCKEHGYLAGEHFTCPICGKKSEVYSRITGYYRPVQNWNDGKTQEYKNRKLYDVEHSCMKKVKTSLVTVRKEDVEIKPVESVKYLFTTKTCPNCKIAKEILKGEDYQIIDAEENQDLVRKYGIMQAPTLVVTDGTKAKKYVNASNIKKYVADVKQTV